MILRIPAPANSGVAVQRCGYAAFRDPRTGSESYTRRLGRGFYPRFHLYAEVRAEQLVLKLHLDQKQPTYLRGSAHSGEYDGPVVTAEGERITRLLTTA